MLRRIVLMAGLTALLAPATAVAARPVATTGGVAAVTPTTATLKGSVDANRENTTYYFQIGATADFGGSTPAASAGARARPVGVDAPVTGLAPATTYHYRLVAQNEDGIDRGARRTFKTRNEPLALALSVTPNPVTPPGGPAQLAGRLSGTNNVGRQVVLQSNPYPYTQGFANVGNAVITDAAGNFSFNVLSLPVNTQFRAFMPQKPEVISPVVVAAAAVRVRAAARKVARRRHSVSVRFRGSVLPPRDGERVDVQKLRRGQWISIAHTRAKDASPQRSRYAIRVRLFRSGQFRVVAESQGEYINGISRTLTIRVRR